MDSHAYLSDLMERARPATIAHRADPDRPGLMIGFGQFFGGIDAPGFQTECINAGAAQYELDHRWWPKHREAVVRLVHVANQILEFSDHSLIPWTEWEDLRAALAAVNEV